MAILKITSTKSKSNNNSKKVIGITKRENTSSKRTNNNPPTKPVLPKKKKNKKRVAFIVNAILSFIMFIGIIGMVSVILFCGYIVITAPKFDTDKFYNKEATIFYDKNGNEFARVGLEQRELVYYDDLPDVFVDALVATEDARFFQHNGFDVVRFVKASLGQVAGQDGAGGASTLTMQLAKNTFSADEDGKIESGFNFKGIVRKFHDIYISIFLIEKQYTKEQIIELYVNRQFFGYNSYGIEEAAQTYFGKSIKDVSLAEASLLAGIFNSPTYYNPFYSTELATQRRATVLSLMVKHGYITQEQADQTNKIPIESLTVEPKTANLNKYQQFIDVVCQEISNTYGLDPYSVPMEVYTTLDPTIQDVMIALNDGSLGYNWEKNSQKNLKNIEIGVAITDTKDGSIRAINGGRTLDRAKAFNRATADDKQPGSTAKPIFAYGPFIEYNNGNPGTIFYDQAYTYSNGVKITNADGKYLGAITLRQALARSRNIPAVQAFQAVDKNKIAEFVNNLHINYCNDADKNAGRSGTDCTLYESYAIGGGLEVSPMQMAAAYGAFARGGYYIEPYSYTKIIFRESGDIAEPAHEKIQVMSEETAYMITDVLITATKQGVGGNISVSGTDVASKTGTATYDDNYLKVKGLPASTSADNWTITYSPDYVISMWYGVDHDKVDSGSYTQSNPASAQKKVLSALMANAIYPKNSKFTKPSGIISASYELETYPTQLPSAYTPTSLISTEIFKKGHEPSEISERFDTLSNPTNGRIEVSNSQINISWNGIKTPEAIDTTFLQELFSKNYGRFAESYLNKRLEYNNSSVGTLGYQVYLENNGSLQPLGYTTDNYFVYNAPYNGTYNFVIKSAYSIFKDNMSSGLKVSTTVTGGIGLPIDPDDDNEDEDNEDLEDEEDFN